MVNVRIGHPDVVGTGEVDESAVDAWVENGWFVVPPPEPEPEPTRYVVKIVKGKETLVPLETPLPDKKESDQDITEDPKEI